MGLKTSCPLSSPSDRQPSQTQMWTLPAPNTRQKSHVGWLALTNAERTGGQNRRMSKNPPGDARVVWHARWRLRRERRDWTHTIATRRKAREEGRRGPPACSCLVLRSRSRRCSSPAPCPPSQSHPRCCAPASAHGGQMAMRAPDPRIRAPRCTAWHRARSLSALRWGRDLQGPSKASKRTACNCCWSATCL